MKLSIELTLTPLKNDFIPPIKLFIKQLRGLGFDIIENPLSTQIYGDYDELMPYLTNEIKASLAQQKNAVLNLKIVTSDRSTYEPNF